jgi:hypothetical protein
MATKNGKLKEFVKDLWFHNLPEGGKNAEKG